MNFNLIWKNNQLFLSGVVKTMPFIPVWSAKFSLLIFHKEKRKGSRVVCRKGSERRQNYQNMQTIKLYGFWG